MAVTLELSNDELAGLFFHLQSNEGSVENPQIENLICKLEAIIYSRFSIDEIEKYKNKIINEQVLGEYS